MAATETKTTGFGLRSGRPAILLAPMEGVTDAPMRALLTEVGGFDFCVSEFLRVSQDVIPRHVFLRDIPELARGARTPAGAPVQIQLLGGDPEKMAASALVALEAGAPGIDINFGCPAPTVNRHDGGATLLKYPTRIREIVEAIRKAVPRGIPVSAKLRLGWDDMRAVHENADKAAEGGAEWIAIHGRTKTQGYTPPAYWGPIGEVRRRLAGIPVVANGEIWTLDDFKRCRDETGCEHFMFGRGALADPVLALHAARELGLAVDSPWEGFSGSAGEWLELLRRFAQLSQSGESPAGDGYVVRRIKQWFRFTLLSRRPVPWFDEVKRIERLGELLGFLEARAAETTAGLRRHPAEPGTLPDSKPDGARSSADAPGCGVGP